MYAHSQRRHERGRACLAMPGYAAALTLWSRSTLRVAQVTAVVSQPDGTKWDGATGYVQDAAKAAGVERPESTAILICGMKGMAEGVKALAAEVGIPEDRVMANF